MPSKLAHKFALAAAACVVFTCLVGTGIAHALPVTFGVAPATALADNDPVHVTLGSFNAVALAKITISECANAYGNNDPLPYSSANLATDCQVIDQVDVSNAVSPLVVTETVHETGIGTGNRACVAVAAFPCDLRVTSMVNQLTSPLPAPVPISFASDAPGVTPMATTTTASITGAPAIVGSPAYARVVVTTGFNSFKPQGAVTIDIDGATVGGGNLAADGTLSVNVGTFAHGPHTIAAHYVGDGSFAPSDAATTPFSVINQDNVSIGDVSVVEGNSGLRRIYLPVVLSQSYPGHSVAFTWTLHTGTTSNTFPDADEVIANSGKITIIGGTVVGYIKADIIGDGNVESNEQFSVTLGLDPAGKSRDYDFRRQTGSVTIIDDDTTPPAGPVASVGDYAMAEGNVKGGHYLKAPLTLSAPQGVPVTVYVTVSSLNAVRGSRLKGGDWNGLVQRKYTFLAGVTRRNVSILEYPDTVDELDLHLSMQITQVLPASAGVGIGRSTGMATILSDE